MGEAVIESPAIEPAKRSKNVPTWALLTGAALVAIVAGAAGAGLSQLAFPAERGAIGPAGPAGEAGEPGPPGPAGASGDSVAIDTNKLGYCFDYNYQYNGNASWIDSVSLFAPTSTNGTLSCPNGSFIPLTPTGPNGRPIQNYSATRSD